MHQLVRRLRASDKPRRRVPERAIRRDIADRFEHANAATIGVHHGHNRRLASTTSATSLVPSGDQLAYPLTIVTGKRAEFVPSLSTVAGPELPSATESTSRVPSGNQSSSYDATGGVRLTGGDPSSFATKMRPLPNDLYATRDPSGEPVNAPPSAVWLSPN